MLKFLRYLTHTCGVDDHTDGGWIYDATHTTLVCRVCHTPPFSLRIDELNKNECVIEKSSLLTLLNAD